MISEKGHGGRKIPEKEKRKILDMYESGMTLRQIAKIYSVDKNVPGRIVGRHGKMRIQVQVKKQVVPGKRERSDGYYIVNMGKGLWRSEHRVIVETVLGRKLSLKEIVHHLDLDKKNNNKNNLLVCDRAYHVWLHAKIRRMQREGS